MLVRLHASEADTLVIDDLSSLSDDMIEQEIVLGHLRRWEINVVCVRDPELSAENPERRLLREFSNRKVLAKRMEGLRLQGERVAARKRTGKSEGAKPYGERLGEGAVMDQIREMHQKGLGNTEISRRLTDQNICPRQGENWHPTTIANMLGARRKAAVRKAKRGEKKSTVRDSPN